MATYAKALVLDGINGAFAVREYAVPDPQPNTFVLRTELAGVCATDAHLYHGRLSGLSFPILLGHEICGIVEKLGKGITHDAIGRPVKEGDRVIVMPGVSCGSCYYCTMAKTPTRCESSVAYGFGADTPENALSGGFGQYLYAQYPRTAFLKTELPPEIAVLNEPLSIAVHGISRAGMQLGSVAVIQGSGAVGLGALLFARWAGAYKTIIVGGPRKRLELATAFGADVTIDVDEITSPEERTRLVRAETVNNRGADIVFDCTGYRESLAEGIGYLRDSAKYVDLGHFTDAGDAPFNAQRLLVRKNITMYGCWGSAVEHLAMALPHLERREYPFERMVSHRLPLADVQQAVDAIASRTYRLPGGREVIKIAIDPWAESQL